LELLGQGGAGICFGRHGGFFESMMGQGQNEQGHRRDQEGNGDENDCYFQIENVFKHLVGDEEFGKFVSHGREEMMDVQRITSFFVGRDLFLFWLRDWNY